MSNSLFLDCVQGSQEWFDARLGCVTGSRIASVVARRKRVKEGVEPEELACRRDMRWELVSEFLMSKATEHFVTQAMMEGIQREPLARAEYEIRTGLSVQQVGFACHPTIKMAGASPDGIVGDFGLLEIKCPRVITHLQYLVDDKIPDEYLPQMVWQMACVPDAEWNDFVSFHPDLKDEYQLFIKRLERTKEVDDLIAAYNLEVEKFNDEVQALLASVKERTAVMA